MKVTFFMKLEIPAARIRELMELGDPETQIRDYIVDAIQWAGGCRDPDGDPFFESLPAPTKTRTTIYGLKQLPETGKVGRPRRRSK